MSQDDTERIRRRYRVSETTLALTNHFYTWERRLRGYEVWPYPVSPEPPFTPLYEQFSPPAPVVDDGRKETFFSRIASVFTEPKTTASSSTYLETEALASDDLGWVPDVSVPDGELCAFQLQLPLEVEYSIAQCSLFVRSLRAVRCPISFELIGCHTYIAVQLTCREDDERTVRGQLEAFFPDAVITRGEDILRRVVSSIGGDETLEQSIVDFGLEKEVVVPFITKPDTTVDSLTSLIAALGHCAHGECAALQILFVPCRAPWSPELHLSVIDDDGSSFFTDAPEFVPAVREKTQRDLYGTVIRAIGFAASERDAHRHVAAIGGALMQCGSPTTNVLIPLEREDYDAHTHRLDVLERITHRSGMLLSEMELTTFVHLPRRHIGSQKLLRATDKTKKRPRIVSRQTDCPIGENHHQGVVEPVFLDDEQRLRHTYVVGASGTGKSTLLLHMLCEDIAAGKGVALLDPHGDLAEDLIARIPEDRHDDVVFIDPSDSDFPVGLNIFQANSDAERTLIAADLPRLFERLSSHWGDQMHAVLSNGILAMLAHKEGGTLLTLRRFLLDSRFRKSYLDGIQDVEVRYYWQKVFPTLSGRPYAPVLTRLDTFLRSEIIRHMVGQRDTRIDYDDILGSGKILIAKLSHGAIGQENASLLGTLIVTAIHQAALRRESIERDARSAFYLYIDEFQNFVTPTMEGLLSGARKYGVGLTLAHQELRQLASRDRDVASSVLANPYTRICFRVGEHDAQSLARGFSSFDAEDLQSLGIGSAIVRVEQAANDFTLNTPRAPAESSNALKLRSKVVERSRQLYAAQRETVETELEDFYADDPIQENRESSNETTGTTSVESKSDIRNEERTTSDVDDNPRVTSETSEKKPPPINDGRGGPSHVYLQSLIKKLAQERGFRALTEHKVEGGFVDVALFGQKQNIAVEISIGTAQDYEVDNISKCIASDFSVVLMVSHDARKLTAIEQKIEKQLSADDLAKVHYLQPEEMIAFLDKQAADNASTEKIVRGYKVKVNYTAVDEQTQKKKREAIARLMVESMKRS